MRCLLPRRVARRARLLFVLAAFCTLLVFFWSGGGALWLSPHRISNAGLYRPSEDAASLCRRHGWRPFRPPKSFSWWPLAPAEEQPRPRKVYDLFMINNEMEWLEVRLNTTYELVDHFVVVEAPLTFTGLPKPLVIKENWDRLRPYHAKLFYHELQYPPDYNPPRPWDREDLQRDASLEQALPRLAAEVPGAAPRAGDALVVADVDEIIRPETLRLLRACEFPRRLTLRSRFYYYGFEFLHRGPEWPHPQATYYEGARSSSAGGGGTTIKPTNLRNSDGGFAPLSWLDMSDLWNAGWHCSTCYRTVADVLRKMASFSHVPLNQAVFRDPNRIADRVRRGKDIWDREGEHYDFVPNNTDVPPFLLANPGRFGYLLNRTGKSAGFEDYPS
ncbi:hypothetical protein RB594_007532 [Gaeumannomyces avenae]